MLRLAALLWIATAASPAVAEVLKNDGAAPGGQIAFYNGLQGDDGFGVNLDVPDELPTYRICAVHAWIGPNGFNVFTVRIDTVDAEGQADQLVWQSDLDAYQLFGSRNQLSAIDLAGFDVVHDARRLRVFMRHVPGAPAPPGIASDTDGITPGRNVALFLQRNGQYFFDLTENIGAGAHLPQPPGDWILRLEVVGLDDVCPGGAAPPPDAGPLPDFGPPPDAGLPPDVGRPAPDQAVLEPDQGITPVDQGVVEPDQAVPAPDMGDRDAVVVTPGLFKLERIVPDRGPVDRNTDVVVNGLGFPFGDTVQATLGGERLLEVQVLSTSTLTAIVPAGMPAGTHALRVARPDGQVAILPAAFTVEGTGALSLVGVDPHVISEDDRPTLVVSGGGFDDRTTFRVGPIVLESVVVSSPERAQGRPGVTLPLGDHDLVASRGEEEARLSAAVSVVPAGGGGAASDGCRAAPLGGPAALALLLLLGRRRRR